MAVPKSRRRYSPSLLQLAFVLHSKSSKGYEMFRSSDACTLPSSQTLSNLSRNVSCSAGLQSKAYFNTRVQKLSAFEQNVVLIIDEIYVSKRVELSSGEIIGFSNEEKPSSTVLCYMFSSVCGSYQDVAGMYALNGVTSSFLHQSFIEMVQFSHDVGLNIVAVSVDNHPANRRFYKELCGGTLSSCIIHPLDLEKKILLFDPTHNLKEYL